MQQLPEQIRVEAQDAAGQVVRHETLVCQEGQNDLMYVRRQTGLGSSW
jgi:hypothetical protein